VSTQRDFKDAGGSAKPKARKRPAKKRAPARGKETTSPPGWLWLLAGLMIGLMIAGLIHLKQERTTSNPTTTAQPKSPPPAKSKSDSTKPAPKEAPPRFDFYEMLPEMEVVVPKSEERPTAASKANKPSASYVLQAGSFRTLTQADTLKARLALLGFEATIQTVTVNGSSTWHRVHLGPYSGQKELNKVRTRLWENKINTVPMRVSN